jgi:hypothetical protein
MPFTFWRVVDGVAVPETDCAAVDANPRGVYGSIEGAIINGGVLATAFKRKTEAVYDAAQWLATGAMVPVGFVTVTEITAEPGMRSWESPRVQSREYHD